MTWFSIGAMIGLGLGWAAHYWHHQPPKPKPLPFPDVADGACGACGALPGSKHRPNCLNLAELMRRSFENS